MATVRRRVDDVQVQGRRIVGQIHELAPTRMGRRLTQQFGERNPRHDPTPAAWTRRGGGGVEPVSRSKERCRLDRVEPDCNTLVIQKREVDHPRNLSPDSPSEYRPSDARTDRSR